MTTSGKIWILACALLLAVGITLGWQRQRTLLLEAELEAQQIRADEVARLGADLARLQANPVSAADLAVLHEDRAALERLRAEIETLKTAGPGIRPAPTAVSVPSEKEFLVSSAWKHAGRVTPSATLETLLWARLHGNVDVIASGLAFENEAARELARSLMASLPPSVGAHRDSPERLIALLAAKDADYGAYKSMWVVEEIKPGEEFLESVRLRQPDVTDVVVVRSLLQTTTGENQHKYLSMQRNYDGWKLVVPTSVVESYADKLKAGTP